MASENPTPNASASQILVTASGATTNLQFSALAVRLDITNYSLWRSTVRSALEAYELDPFLIAGGAPPATLPPAAGATTGEPNQAFAVWRRKDRLVLLWLRSTLPTPMLGHVSRATTTAELWTLLAQTFQSHSRVRQMHLKQQLQSLTKGNQSIMEYVDRKRSISDALAESLSVVSDDDLVSYILFGLGPEFAAFRTAVSMRLEPISSNELLGLLLQEEQRIFDTYLDTTMPTAHAVHRRFSDRQPPPFY